MPTEDAYSSGHLVLSHFWIACVPMSSRDQSLLNLSCLRTFEFRTSLGISLLLFIFQLLGECQWVPEGTCSQVLRSTSVDSSRLRATKFSVLKLIKIEILWVYYTIPFGFSLFWNFRTIIFNFWNHFVWLRITDEGSWPEMRIWSILLIESDLKWCIHLSRSLFILGMFEGGRGGAPSRD